MRHIGQEDRFCLVGVLGGALLIGDQIERILDKRVGFINALARSNVDMLMLIGKIADSAKHVAQIGNVLS